MGVRAPVRPKARLGRSLAGGVVTLLTATAVVSAAPAGAAAVSSEGLVGFATISGYGRTGTNGGTGGPTVTVGNYAQLAAAVADDLPRIVRVSGTITGSGDDMLDVGSNKTIIGVGSSATISGFGLDVNGWGPAEVDWGGDTCDPAERDRFTPVQNVIIRNLSFRNSPDDSINVQCYSHHVWIDHNTFYPASDGSVDIKRGSDLATVSYNRFAGTDKSMLLGHSDNNAAQDTGYLRVTYHHNWFDGSNTRHPGCGSATPTSTPTTSASTTTSSGSGSRAGSTPRATTSGVPRPSPRTSATPG
ncbi:pectate lyase family protein [Plantactinospora veratri]